MKVAGKHYRSIWREGTEAAVHIIDQTKLPFAFETLRLDSAEAVAEAIKAMRVRGAPLIGVSALDALAHLAAPCADAETQVAVPSRGSSLFAKTVATTLARDEGILKRLRGTPLPPWVYMAGRVGAAALVAIVSAVVVIAVAAGAYDIVVPWRAVPSAALTLVVGAFCFCALALAITVLIPTADTAFPVAWGTALPLAFISDVFLPLDSGPDWLKSIADVFPVRHLADALEYAFNPVTGGARPQWVDLGVMLAWGLAATAVALRWFRWEPHAGGPATGRRLRLPRRRGGRERG